jgi:dipeptidyl aminopeptidase/acylaminoacyl peptidase
MPKAGFPVLVANHGTHPDPPKYGFTADGRDERPGDYYRSVPGLYTSRGFLVVMPDYRGHNASEGVEYARGFLASCYFAEDVLALVGALDSLPQADHRNVFMWGHSLGGEVTLKALLATNRIRAASLWSTVGGDIWQQSYYYSTRGDDQANDDSERSKAPVDDLKREVAALGGSWDWRDADATRHLGRLGTPVILHHARGDASVPFGWSRELAGQLYLLGKPYVMYAYDSSAHYLEAADRELAADRDAAFFGARMVQ